MTIARSTHAKKNGSQFTAQSGSRAVSKSLANAFDNVKYPQQSVARPQEIAQTSTKLYASPAPSDVSGDHASVLVPAYTGIEKRNPALAEYRRFCDRIKALAPMTTAYPSDLLRARRAAFQSLIQERTY